VVDALLFWVLLIALGTAGLPFAAFMFRRLPGGGLALARPLALLLVGYPLWLLASLHIVPYGRWSATAAIAVVFAIAALAWRRSSPFPREPEAVPLWLVGELLFTATFFGWTLLHSFSPDVWQTEKPMDMAIVNAINRGDSFPPHDPWLAGTDLNYYYFGHYLVALLVRVLGLDSTVGFNLAVPLFYALSAAAVFAVASALYLGLRPARETGRRSPLLPGLAAAGLAVGLGNLAGAAELFRGPWSLSLYNWWTPSRVIPGTANEFPFFSFLLADLHAHMLAVPFALLAVAFALQLAIGGPRLPRQRSAPAVLAPAAELLLGALVLGSLYAINSLDYPTGVAIGVFAVLLWVLDGRGRGWALVWGAAWLAASVALFLPFWLGFSPTTGGVGLVSNHEHFSRFAADVGLIYGVPLWIVASVFAHRLSLPFRYLAWAGVGVMVTLVLLSPSRLAGQAFALTLAALALFVAFRSAPVEPAYRALWLLIGVALGLIALGEFAYVRDAFDGTPSYRFNTVFKAGYQAWFLLAVVGGVAIFWNRGRLSRPLRAAWLAGLVVLVALAVVYPVAGSYSRTAGFSRHPTLEGLGWLERRAPGDVKAIRWMRANVNGSPVVLEAVGPDFDPQGRGRISTFTGLPTVIAWGGHEVQWGHDVRGRGEDVQVMYGTRNLSTARRLLARYDVRYVVVGALERHDYPAKGLAKFRRLGRVVFRSDATLVYRVASTG
jgi:YYY domain-containing protein